MSREAARISWTSETWNPVTGCTKVSAGCDNCYAERDSRRLAGMARSKEAPTPKLRAYLNVIQDNHWSGVVNTVESALLEPLTYSKPTRVFVNSMSDLFHRDVPDDFIKRVFGVMNETPQHQYQVLTKRPERLKKANAYLDWTPNICMGTSVEDDRVIKRIDRLRECDATIRFLSLEPLLGPLPELNLAGIHWVIVGGESGPGSRLMEAEWARDLRDQCVDQGIAYFFKQFGTNASNPVASDPTMKSNGGMEKGGCLLDGQVWHEFPERYPASLK